MNMGNHMRYRLPKTPKHIERLSITTPTSLSETPKRPPPTPKHSSAINISPKKVKRKKYYCKICRRRFNHFPNVTQHFCWVYGCYGDPGAKFRYNKY